ncbi:MAG: beta-lactamase family protein [Undibacterium sp.]|nr:beta-lactamase family protein [Undibacterium sp.]
MTIFFSVSSISSAAPQKKPVLVTPTVYPHAMEPIGNVRQIYDGVLTPEMAVNSFRNIDRLFPTRRVLHGKQVLPLVRAATGLEKMTYTDRGRTIDLETYLELNRVAAILVLKDGKIKLEKYRFGNTENTRWMSMSIAKSITSTLVGAALKDGKISSLEDAVIKYVPELKGSAYQDVTVGQVLTMSSGVRWNEAYADSRSDRRRLLDAQLAQRPGALMEVMKSLPSAAPSGTRTNYNTGETQVVAQVLRNAIGMPLANYLSQKIWSKYGMEQDAYWWLDSPEGVEIGGSGLSATLRDYGRFGLFMLDEGKVGRESILPANWVAQASAPHVLKSGQSVAYGYLWWPASSEIARSERAYAAIGIHGQFLYINPQKKMVIVIWGAQPKPVGGAVLDDHAFFAAVSAALGK